MKSQVLAWRLGCEGAAMNHPETRARFALTRAPRATLA